MDEASQVPTVGIVKTDATSLHRFLMAGAVTIATLQCIVRWADEVIV
jgi:hypothetical protein